MPFPFADILSPAPSLPLTSGASSTSSQVRGDFADALAAVQPDGAVDVQAGQVVTPGGAIPPRIVDELSARFVLTGESVAGNTPDVFVAPDVEVPAGNETVATESETVESPARADDPNVAAGVITVVPAPPTPAAPAPSLAGADADLLAAAGPSLPVAPSGTEPDEPLLEGRSSTAGAPPPQRSAGLEAIPEAPILTDLEVDIDVAAPRASAPASTNAQVGGGTAALAPNAPAAAGEIAALAHVTSVQAAAMSGPDDAGTKTAIAAPEEKLTADAATMAKAADKALDVLTKDRADGRSVPQPPNAVPAEEPAATDADRPAAEPAKPVKASEAEPEAAEPPKPVSSDKPAPEPRPNLPQPTPVADRHPVHDAAAKPHPHIPALPAAVIPHIASEMASRVKPGMTQFDIRLDPPELGRVDVRIEVDGEGRVVSRLTVEKAETLDLLKADQRALERALHDAGFKSEQNSVSFQLRDERGQGQAKFDDGRQVNEHGAPTEIEEEPARLAAGIAYRAALRGPGGIDLTV